MLGAKVVTVWEKLAGAWRWWLTSLGPFLLACGALAALRGGLLPKLHTLYVRGMTYILREEPGGTKPYKQSYFKVAEVPLATLLSFSLFCQLVPFFLGRALMWPKATAAAVLFFSKALDMGSKVCVGWFLYGVVNQKIARSSRGLAQKSDIMGAETSRQEAQVLAVGQTARILVCFCTFLACLPALSIDLGTVLSFCGMGGLAISLLSKGVFVNLIGSLTIYLTQPFTLGDWIQTDDGEVDGWVQSMGPYHTVVMRWDRRPLYVPNSRFLQVRIVNASRMTNRRVRIDVPIRFSDLDKVGAILEDIRELVENHKKVDPEMHRLVRLRKIGRHAAYIWVSCYTRGINLNDYVAVNEDILLSIKNIMYKHGTTFATTLQRELRRVDSTGAFLSEPLGFPYGGAQPASREGEAEQEEEEAFARSQPMLASQKALLASEVQRLKDMQEGIWARERDLKDSEAALERDAQRLREERDDVLAETRAVERQEEELAREIDSFGDRELEMHQWEEAIDAGMDELGQREDDLDQLVRELAQREGGAGGQPDAAAGAELEEKAEREEAALELEKSRELLSQERTEIQEERTEIEQIKEHMAEQKAEAGGPSEDSSDDKEPQEVQDMEEELRVQKIAESLGGE